MKIRINRYIFTIAAITAAQAVGAGDAPKVEFPTRGVTMVYDDNGSWGGGSMGTAHQNQPLYQTRKFIDLSGLPEGALDRAQEARLRVFFAIQDYSWNVGDHTWNGLNERFELVVNGQSHEYKTSDGFPGRDSGLIELVWDWHDFLIPLAELKAGVNEFVFRKLPGGNNDDYVYVGIDNTAHHGNSEVSFDGGESWTGEKLNAIDAKGEYMVRLVLMEESLKSKATWTAGGSPPLSDPHGLIGYAGTEGDELRLELDPSRIDPRAMVGVTVDCAAPEQAEVIWECEGRAIPGAIPSTGPGTAFRALPARAKRPDTVIVRASGIVRATILYERRYLPSPPVVDMCPDISQPAGARALRPPGYLIDDAGEVSLLNSELRCKFSTADGLHMTSLFNEITGSEVLADPDATGLFLLEADGERFSARDARVRAIQPRQGQSGFAADLFFADLGLAAYLEVSIGEEPEIGMSLRIVNEGDGDAAFKVAFPHLGGLQLSDDPDGDFYLFPYFGGAIAGVPTYLRTAYGENSCWWQMIDLFSPARGGGLYLRCTDDTGLFKCPAFRKGQGYGDYTFTTIGTQMDRSMWWDNGLEPGPGSAMTFEYIQRTRKPGEAFEVPAARIGVHEGDWRVAMQRYADWAHEVWQWRPGPSRLTDRWAISAPGWGQKPLYSDGKYDLGLVPEGSDVAELMSYWQWSKLGPWGAKMSHETLPEELGKALYDRYAQYWVTNPATGELEYPLNRGDYDYNEDWGGLPALKQYVKDIQDTGRLATYYVEGILCCDTTRMGQQYGAKYGVENPLWKDGYNCPKNPEGYVASYGSWNMCADTEFWPDYLAEVCARLMRDTGADGLRLDEYGHRGYVCHNDQHEHLFAEPGHNAWMQAVARACRIVHKAMDEVAPDLVLMTEFPGNDHLSATLDGCIVYETASHITPFRPVPCNLFRFYFPECKTYDLSHIRGLVDDNFKLWNGAATFGGLFPASYLKLLQENTDVLEGPDVEALVKTLKPRIYANRFASEAKVLTTLCNDTGYTYDGPVIPADNAPEAHYVDLLTWREVEPIRYGDGWALSMKIERDGIACVARLSRLMSAARDGDSLNLSLNARAEGLRLVVADAEGRALVEQEATPGQMTVEAPAEGEAVCVKLLREGMLVDAAGVPPVEE